MIILLFEILYNKHELFLKKYKKYCKMYMEKGVTVYRLKTPNFGAKTSLSCTKPSLHYEAKKSATLFSLCFGGA